MTPDTAPEPEVAVLPEAVTAVIDGAIPFAELPDFFDRSYTSLAATLAEQGIAITGPAFALYHRPPTDRVDLEVGFPTDGTVERAGPVRPGSLPAGTVARVVHEGSYDDLGTSWERLRAWIAGRGLTPGTVIWEVYVTEPTPDTDPADLRTQLHWTLE
jgi:effector-binding domain-containing protein